MKIKTICFDLDGVLLSTKELHFEAFNRALETFGLAPITKEDHLKHYDGLSTRQKIRKYGAAELEELIWQCKQNITEELLAETEWNVIDKRELLYGLSAYDLYLVTNSIRSTTKTILEKAGLGEFFKGVVSNENVREPKPHPEGYLKCIVDSHCRPDETLVIEDSPTGVQAAQLAGAHCMMVKSLADVTLDNIKRRIAEIEDRETAASKVERKMNIVIPCAGAGSRFEQAGYSWPKPLIPIMALGGKTMIQAVTESIGIKAHYIYIIQEKHDQVYNCSAVLKAFNPDCSIIKIDGMTEGAAITVLKARGLIDNDTELMVVNSDQIVEWDPLEFFYKMNYDGADGGFLTFTSNHPRWSFAQVDEYGNVLEVAEKLPLPGNHATCGLYWFNKGSEFVKYADRMIEKNIRTNSEFFLCPVYNQYVEDGRKIKIYDVKKMWGIGDPMGLQFFEEHYPCD